MCTGVYRSVQETADCTDLVGVQPPVLQLLLEQGAADVSGIVELPSPVVVQDLTEHNGVPEPTQLVGIRGDSMTA